MEQFTQLVVPGTPLRVILSGTWAESTEKSYIQGSVDLLSEDLSSVFVGSSTEGVMTLDEWASLCYTLLEEQLAEVRRIVAEQE